MLGTSRMADHSRQCMTVGPLCPACEHVLPCLLAAGSAVSWCGMRRLTQRKQLSLVRWSLLVPAWSWLGRAATNRALSPPPLSYDPLSSHPPSRTRINAISSGFHGLPFSNTQTHAHMHASRYARTMCVCVGLDQMGPTEIGGFY